MPTSVAQTDRARTWFIAGTLSAMSVQVIAVIASRTILAFGDEQFALIGAMGSAAALLVGSIAIVGGSLASRESKARRVAHLPFVALVLAAALVPVVMWRSGGPVIVSLIILLGLCALASVLLVFLLPRRTVANVTPTAPPQGHGSPTLDMALQAALWGVWGALLALLVAIEVSVVAQAMADPLLWADQVSADFDGADGLVLGRRFSMIAGVISAPLLIALVGWIFYWAAAAYSRPRALRAVPINPFPASGRVRLALMVTWATGLLLLQFLTLASWQSTGGEALPQPVVLFFVLQQLFVAPVLGVVVAFAVRGERRQRPLGLGIVVGAIVAAGVLAISLLL